MAPDRFALGVALGIGILVRAIPIIAAGSVVGDGGLWMAMIDDIRAAGLSVPAVTSYNGLEIPFVYPPAALLGAATLAETFGIATIDVLRWAPLALSILGLVAFAWLAYRTLNPGAAAAATVAYALMPSAYGWLVAGGGLTRGAGLVFALLAAGIVAAKPGREATWLMAVGAGILLGLSALCHPQTAALGVIACVVLSWRKPARPWLLHVGIAAATAFLVALPWLARLVAQGGVDAFVSGGSRSEPLIGLIRLVNLRFSAAPFMDVVGFAAIIGLVTSLVRRRFRIPVLLVAVYVAGVGGGEFLAAPVWALLAGSGVMTVVFVMRRGLDDAPPRLARAVIAGTAAVALFLALIGSVGSTTDRSSKLHPLPPALIGSMAWLRDNTPPDAAVIVPSDEVWGFDDVGEWLPAIAERHSVGTVQGSEWLGSEGFAAQLQRHADITSCAAATADCYAGIDPNAWIYVPKGQLNGLFSPAECCPALRSTLEDAGYSIVYDGPGATIAAPSG
jgi:hypothetical protein